QISRKHKHGNFTITSRAAPIDFNNYYEIGHKGITGIGGKANTQENAVPKYLKCSVTIWLEALERHVIDITNIVRPGGGTLIVDLLADIDMMENQKPPFQKESCVSMYVLQLRTLPLIRFLHIQFKQRLPFTTPNMQGEFMAAIMKHLIKQKYIDPNLKRDIEDILPHILLSGNGALPLEAVETRNLKEDTFEELFKTILQLSRTKKREISLGKVYGGFEQKQVEALLGIHSLSVAGIT
ncbi:unnamed protein product, partial [Timema podura]|nr:unnamed protein product [Timema podura]